MTTTRRGVELEGLWQTGHGPEGKAGVAKILSQESRKEFQERMPKQGFETNKQLTEALNRKLDEEHQLSYSQVGRILNGRSTVRFGVLVALTEVMGMGVQERNALLRQEGYGKLIPLLRSGETPDFSALFADDQTLDALVNEIEKRLDHRGPNQAIAPLENVEVETETLPTDVALPGHQKDSEDGPAEEKANPTEEASEPLQERETASVRHQPGSHPDPLTQKPPETTDTGQTGTQTTARTGRAIPPATSSRTRMATITVSVSAAALLLIAVLYWNTGGFGTQNGEGNALPTTLAAVNAGNDGGTKLPAVPISQTITASLTATPLSPASTPSTTRTEPASTVLPTETPTWTATPTASPDLAATATQEAEIRATDIALAVSQTLVAITQTARSDTTPTIIPTATSTAMPTSTMTRTATPHLSFTEDFSSNDRNWFLGADSRGAVRISQGSLVMSPKTNSILWIAVPGTQVSGDFYFQAQVSLLQGHFCDSNAGLSIGEPNGNHHSFIIGATCGTGNYVAFMDGSTVKFSTPVGGETLLHVSSPIRTISLEATNGLLTFYVDGRSLETFPIEDRYGNSVGLLSWDSGGYLPSTIVAFDNVIVRDQK